MDWNRVGKKMPCCYLECCRRVWFRNFFCFLPLISVVLWNVKCSPGQASAHETRIFCTRAGRASEFGQNARLEDLQLSHGVCPCIKIKHILCDKQLCVNLACQIKCFAIHGIYFAHPSSKEPTEDFGKGEAPWKIKMLKVMGSILCLSHLKQTSWSRSVSNCSLWVTRHCHLASRGEVLK